MLFSCVYMYILCTFQPGCFTGLGIEGVNTCTQFYVSSCVIPVLVELALKQLQTRKNEWFHFRQCSPTIQLTSNFSIWLSLGWTPRNRIFTQTKCRVDHSSGCHTLIWQKQRSPSFGLTVNGCRPTRYGHCLGKAELYSKTKSWHKIRLCEMREKHQRGWLQWANRWLPDLIMEHCQPVGHMLHVAIVTKQ